MDTNENKRMPEDVARMLVDILSDDRLFEEEEKIEEYIKNTESKMKHFTYKELTKSETADKYGIDNEPHSLQLYKNLNALVRNILDPLRSMWGGPVIVTSGYRCGKLNSKVGGSGTSSHITGFAADIKPKEGSLTDFKKKVYRWLNENPEVMFDQFISEPGWLHIGYKSQTGKQRKQYLQLESDNLHGGTCYQRIVAENGII